MDTETPITKEELRKYYRYRANKTRLINPDKTKAYIKQYYNENKEYIIKTQREKYFNNEEYRQQKITRAKQYYQDNKEKIKQANKLYYQRKKEKKALETKEPETKEPVE